jgi:outer membrane receptor protein involved in Fe transport
MKTKSLGALALLCVSLILVPATVFADGTISGVVINGFTGEPVRGATLMVEGTDISFKAGVGGDFRTTAPAGTYNVVVTQDGFEAQKVTNVVVADGGVADFAVVLLPSTDQPDPFAATGEAEGAAAPDAVAEGTEIAEPPLDPESGEEIAAVASDAGPAETSAAADSGVFIGEITVEATADTSTEAALLAERKNAPMISDSIGSQEIKKNVGSDAAQAVKRVTGVSLQEGKYVFVRGLGERYSNTQINGSKMPSTEFDRKVVPFDLFPSNLISKIQISKSYTADKPGDFAAGLVEMNTLDFPVSQTANITMRAGYDVNTTGEDFGYYAGGLSFNGSGGQPLPSGFPTEQLVRRSPITGQGFTPEELEEIGQTLVGEWRADGGPTATPWSDGADGAPLGTGFDLGYGATFGKFGLVLAATHRQTRDAWDEEQNFYRPSNINESGVEIRDYYDFTFNNEKVKRSLVANFAYRFGVNHSIKLNSLLTSLANSNSSYQTGVFEDLASTIRSYRVDYKIQDVQSFQLSGEHFLNVGKLGSLVEWRATNSEATTEQNLRATIYNQSRFDEVFRLTDLAESGFMFYNDLLDTADDYDVSWTTFLSGAKSSGSIKGGLRLTTNDRDFAGRRIRFQHRDTSTVDLSLPPEQIFTEENINRNTFEIEEITRPTDAYVANQTVGAAYGLLDWSRSSWRIIAGLRYEDSQIDLTTRDPQLVDQDLQVTSLSDQDWMPSLAIVYRLASSQNLRVSASQTVNRPEFRELAPFQFTVVSGGYEIIGNPDLEVATIQSLDARWEWFPGPQDVIAASIFYKRFDKPIEQVLVPAITELLTFENADTARNQGLELEFRRTFSPFLLVLNYAYIDSQITLQPGTVQTNEQRPLVGQPDHVGNVVLEWSNPRSSSLVRLLYNYVGEQVHFAAAYGLPDVIQQPRSTVGLAYLQGFRLFGLDWNVKLSGENLTDNTWEYTQGGELWRRFKPGPAYGLTFGLTVF